MWTNLIKYGGYTMAFREIMDRIVQSKRERQKAIRRRSAMNIALGATVGAALGAAVGLLFAPRAGKETREDIAKRTNEAFSTFKENISEKRARLADSLRAKSSTWQEAAEKCVDAVKEAAQGEAAVPQKKK
jgi:gas vesicle protein